MADDSDDDLYGDSETKAGQTKTAKKEDDASSGDEPMDEGQDSGDDDDEEDSDSESDVEIIIDKPAPAPNKLISHAHESKAIKIEAPPQPSTTPSQAAKATAAGATSTSGTVPQLLPGTAYPAQRTSTIDVNGNPVYPPAGKEILAVDMEADMAEEQKIWRRPGEDQSDYFNYGFDEFTWEMYRQRQVNMAQTLQQQEHEMANMRQMMGQMPGMPAMPGPGPSNAPAGAPTGPSAGAGGMPPGMMNEAEMAMAFQHLMSQGVDPSQMDMNTFMQMAGGGGFGGPVAQQGAAFQQGSHGGGGGGGGGGRGGRGGRGRGW